MTLQQPERLARLWLSLCSPPGDPLVGELVATLGAVRLRDILSAGSPTPLSGRPEACLKRLRESGLTVPHDGHMPYVLDAISREGLQVLTPGDTHWPASLKDLGTKAPLALFFRGAAEVLGRTGRNVAIVGTRTPSALGLNAAREIAWHQINAGRTIVSGGAKGIDAVGHMVSLESGVPTIAVLAQSPNRPYPPEHRGMCAEIAHRGVVVSEVPPGIHHGGKGFLARNRLIAALATLTIVVEAPLRSGAISTAAHAAHLEREVMAVLYKKSEAHSGATQVEAEKKGTIGLPGDNRGAERVIEQWAGETILWPPEISQKA
ncbi:DNA processing/competence protein DprA [Pontimonas salivibrio]|uniref:DNA processing/competence protein DprA n=1 Tax=Pontimonas salivibrio TaxID=1159327 RepID=A0A2L2BPJ3_9MICO|nr:DNA-processing protein DprA [Pontimonas salivibrio]AVG23586.1 DNA processing/competence protein DprA [Pontimonas salivibrio]